MQHKDYTRQHGFNIGDLVTMPHCNDRILRTPFSADPLINGVGLVIDDRSVKNRIGIMWSGSNCVDYEPHKWLKVVNESN